MSDMWTCQRHQTKQVEFCALCVEAFRNRRPAADMTIEERAAELEGLPKQLTIPFTDLHQRITELMGRDVWTHELAYPEQLVEELRNGEKVGIADVLGKLPWDKPCDRHRRCQTMTLTSEGALAAASQRFLETANNLDTLYGMDQYARQLVSLADAIDEADLDEEGRDMVAAELERVLAQMLLKIERSAGFVIDMEKRAEAAHGEEKRLARLKKRRQGLADRVREGLRLHMLGTGEAVIDTPRFTLARRLNNPAVEVVDRYAVPDEFWRPEKVPSESDPEARSCDHCGGALVVSKSKVTTGWRATGGKSTPTGVTGGEIPDGVEIVRHERLQIS